MSQEDERRLETRHGRIGPDHDGSKAKRAATQYFMANALPGTLREVTENCELLVDNPSAISNRFMEDTLEQSAEDQFHVITFFLSDGEAHQAILCPAGKLDKSLYLHSPTKHVLSLTVHGSDLSVSASPAPPDAFPPEMEPRRAAFEAELTNYVKERYSCSTLLFLRTPVEPNQAVSVFSHKRADATPVPQLTAVMSTLVENRASYWTSSWASEWRVFFSLPDPSEVRIEGDVRIRAFLQEDASVQANFSRHFGLPEESAESADVNCSRVLEKGSSPGICSLRIPNSTAPDVLALELVNAIGKNERILMKEIETFFTNRALILAKSTRRVLPVYGKSFDWKQQSIQLRPQHVSIE